MDRRATLLPHRGMHRACARNPKKPDQPMTTTVYITREIEITVEARFIPAVDATYMQPEEHANVEIIGAHVNGDEIELTEAEIDEVCEMVLQDPPHRDY